MKILFNISESEFENGKFVFHNPAKEMSFQTEITALTFLNSVDDDTRLVANIEELKARYQVGNSILAKIAGITEDVIENIIKNPENVSINLKYSLYSKVVYLLFLFSAREK